MTHSNEKVADPPEMSEEYHSVKVELAYSTGELVEVSEEINSLSQLAIRDKIVLTSKLIKVEWGMASSHHTKVPVREILPAVLPAGHRYPTRTIEEFREAAPAPHPHRSVYCAATGEHVQNTHQ